jgi:DNA-binding IclR family transcriptional regulator
MKPRRYFPLGKAYGEAFCNRIAESKWLAENLINTKHSLLIAPRRYGKSSLAEKAISETKLPFVKINFHLCASEAEVAQLIIDNVTQLIGTSIGQVEKIITSVKKYVSNLTPKLSLGDNIATLELVPKQQENHAVVISETLLLLDKLLRDKNKKAVIFFDEFQEIAKIAQSRKIEGAIRTAAQEMQNLSLIFSGSIRSLLLRMFEEESRPLYKLCRKLKLERISASDYKKHINKIAAHKWHQELEAQVFDEIMKLSNRHPYYVNYLCDMIWQDYDLPPNINNVKAAWAKVVAEEWSDALRELSTLSLNQRKVLRFIAKNTVNNITSQDSCLKLSLPSSTISSALKALIEKDYVEINMQKHYKIINPLLFAVLTEYKAI